MKAELAALTAAIQSGDLAASTAIVEANPAVAKDWRPILEAALHGRPEIVTLLLQNGADPNAQSTAEARNRPLHRAIEVKKSVKRTLQHRKVVTLLLDAGADVDGLGCWYDGRPLETAAREGDKAMARLLLDRGARRDIASAVLTCDVERLDQELAREPALALRPIESGAQPLHLLGAGRLNREHSLEIAGRLRDAGADVNAVAHMRHGAFPVIHFACWGEKPDLPYLQWLLDQGAKAHEGFYETLWHGSYAAADLLTAAGADINGAWTYSRRPLLHEMIHWGRNKSVIWLLSKGADPNVRDDAGWNALHYASSRGVSTDLMERLRAAGGDPNAVDHQGRTPEAVAKPR